MANEILNPFSMEAQGLRLGVYEHYKGLRYEVLGVGRHTETLEEIVIYRSLYGTNDLWARPLSMFIESIEIEGIFRSRFRFID